MVLGALVHVFGGCPTECYSCTRGDVMRLERYAGVRPRCLYVVVAGCAVRVAKPVAMLACWMHIALSLIHI